MNNEIDENSKPIKVEINKDEKPPGESYSKFKTALKEVKLKDFENIEKVPCMRKSLLFGIGGGFTFGLINLLSTKRMKSAWNWTFATGIVTMIGTWSTCRYKRDDEMNKMRYIQDRVNKSTERSQNNNSNNEREV